MSNTRDGPHPVLQARSRETLTRLLDAAQAVLAEKGLDGTTVPEIAARAALSVGVVYRRFPDKDALLRAVYERFFAVTSEGNRAALTPGRWAGASLATVARAVVTSMVRGYRSNAGLLRALLLYARTHPDAEFRARADALNADALGALAELVLSRRGTVTHPDPERAARLGLVVLACALYDVVLLDAGVAGAALPPTDDGLADELTRMYLGYLGVAG